MKDSTQVHQEEITVETLTNAIATAPAFTSGNELNKECLRVDIPKALAIEIVDTILQQPPLC